MTNVLQLNNLNAKDSAIYTCYAQNSKGSITKNFTVNVQSDHVSIVDPSLSSDQSYNYKGPDYSIIKDKLVPNDPKNTTVEEGGSASFECKAMVNIFSALCIHRKKKLELSLLFSLTLYLCKILCSTLLEKSICV